MSFEKLNKCKGEAYNCSICGQCVQGPVDPYRPNAVFPDYMPIQICPMREKNRFLTYSAAGMNTIARGLLEGSIEVTDELVAAIYECTLCDHCETNCGEVFHLIQTMLGKDIGHGVKTPEVVRALRADLVKMGKAPTPNVQKVADAIEKSHNRFGADQAKRAAWLPEDIQLSDKPEVVFFVGCMSSFRNKQISTAFARILQKAGVPFTILGEEEWCCGGPQLYNAGLLDQFAEHVKHNVEAIRATGASKVVAVCADCYRTLKIDYPTVEPELGFEVLHSAELLAQLLDEGKIEFVKEISETITYQDPCQLSRVAGVVDEPRKVLQSIPGIQLEEMQGNKQYTVCCGHYPIELPETARLAGERRIAEAEKTGAETLVTACAFCQMSLSAAAKKSGKCEVVDLVELVAEAMGLNG